MTSPMGKFPFFTAANANGFVVFEKNKVCGFCFLHYLEKGNENCRFSNGGDPTARVSPSHTILNLFTKFI